MKEYFNKVIISLYIIIIILVIKHKCLEFIYIKSNSRQKLSSLSSMENMENNENDNLIDYDYSKVDDNQWGHFVFIDEDIYSEREGNLSIMRIR